MKPASILALILLISRSAFAQVTADFSLPTQACIKQNISPDNQSANAVRYEWDLCQGDLILGTSAENAKTLGSSVTTGVDMVFDGTNWYGFVVSQGTNAVLRLDFGNSIYTTPNVINLGNISGKLNSPTDIKVVSENGNWYGFVYGLADPMISRIDFGTSLANLSATASTVVTGSGTVNGGFDILFDGTKWNIVLTRNSSVTVVQLPAVTGTPVVSDIIADVADPFGTSLGDITLQKDGANYYGFVVAWGNRTLQKLSFGTNLFSTPVVTNLSVTGLSDITPYGIDIGVDNGHKYLLISSLEGKIMRVDLGVDLSSITPQASILNLPGIENTLKIRLIKNQSSWIALAPSWNSTNLYRIVFTNSNCADFPNVITTTEPVITFNTSDTKYITLRAFAGNGWYSEITKSITITNNQSPEIDFTVNGICANFPSAFNATGSGIQTYNWQFGDASSGGTPSPSHTYAGGGDYPVTLTVSATNGCSNTISKTVSVYNKPTASFTLPTGLICTNNEFVFTNTTSDVFNGNLSYEWLVNSASVSTTRDLKYTLTTTGNNLVQLKTSIPGCSDQAGQTITNVLTGPTVSFTYDGQCQQKEVSFLNGSTGSIASYSWSFDDGGATSTAPNPTRTFQNHGVYSVSLSSTGTNGCVSSTSKDINIYTVPVVTFSTDLPPFSCSGTPTQFHDTTIPPGDSNIQSWNWSFGDGGNGTGKNPIHTYADAGSKNVSLSITTDKGCNSNGSGTVSISTSPAASFSVDAACVNQSTKLNDTSTGGVTNWQWKIGSIVYNTQNIQHTFSTPGSYSVQLNVTGQNNCTNTVTKQVIVPVVPTVAFEVRNPCERQASTFTDVTSSIADPVVEHNWTFNNNANATGANVDFIFNSAGSYNATLQIKTTAGCVYSGSRQVTINPTPVASFTMSDESGPPPLHVFFTNTSTGAASYEWNFNDGNPISTVTSPDYLYASVGDYPVNLIAYNTSGCKDALTKIVSVVVPLNELSIEDFTLVQPQGTNAYRGYLKVRNNGNYRIDGFFVTYGVGGGLQLRETVVASLNKGEAGTYVLGNEFLSPGPSAYICAELIDDANILDNKACKTFSEQAIILDSYPNPADVYLNIESVLPASGIVHIRLYTSSGGLSFDKTFDAGTGLSRLSLDVQNLSPGIYIAVITAGGNTSSRRVMIAR